MEYKRREVSFAKTQRGAVGKLILSNQGDQ